MSNRVGFPWGYGHYVVFAAAAAVGAGVGVMVDSVTGHAHVSDTGAAAAFTIPVVLYVAAVVFIQALLFGVHRLRLAASVAAVLARRRRDLHRPAGPVHRRRPRRPHRRVMLLISARTAAH